MKVEATESGYDGWKLREPGEQFAIDKNKFDPRWMKMIDELDQSPSDYAIASSAVSVGVVQEKRKPGRPRKLV